MGSVARVKLNIQRLDVHVPNEIDYKSLYMNVLNGKTILMVEDNEINSLITRTLLQEYGLRVLESSDGQNALDMLSKNATDIDLILMDLSLPNMDGYQATKKIRETLNITIPIFAFTAFSTQDDINRCMNAGFNEIIFKPLNEEIVIGKLIQYLSQKTLMV